MSDLANDLSVQRWVRLWCWVLALSCVGMVVLVLVVNWVMSGFHGLGLHFATGLALVMGTIAATALGVVLMGLLFYSERVRDADEASN